MTLLGSLGACPHPVAAFWNKASARVLPERKADGQVGMNVAWGLFLATEWSMPAGYIVLHLNSSTPEFGKATSLDYLSQNLIVATLTDLTHSHFMFCCQPDC